MTDGTTRGEALREGADCLTSAIFARIKMGEEIPEPSPIEKGHIGIAPDPGISLKAGLHIAMRNQMKG